MKAYANAVSVELFVNGESRGAGRNTDGRLPTVFVWENVQLEQGRENSVTIRAEYSDGSTLEDHASWFGE